MKARCSSDGPSLPHPCFDPAAKGRFGRIHMPVAPTCNIQCAYCRRSCDCVHESRPGVTSRVMDPEGAAAWVDETVRRMPFITVAGIAGPGDAFAEPTKTLATLERVRRAHPRLNLCLSTNGLGIGDHIDDLADLRVGFVTVTINAVDPAIGARIYSRVRFNGDGLRGLPAAALLLDRQLSAVAKLKKRGVRVKINTVVIPGINDGHVIEIAQTLSRLKADLHNLIGVIPVKGTPFEHLTAPSEALLSGLRCGAEAFIPQMRHCVRCRADAVGLLHDERTCRSPVADPAGMRMPLHCCAAYGSA
ncbi:MAG: radical SAM protein [Thermodesulfobacteriota bacterium]